MMRYWRGLSPVVSGIEDDLPHACLTGRAPSMPRLGEGVGHVRFQDGWRAFTQTHSRRPGRQPGHRGPATDRRSDRLFVGRLPAIALPAIIQVWMPLITYRGIGGTRPTGRSALPGRG